MPARATSPAEVEGGRTRSRRADVRRPGHSRTNSQSGRIGRLRRSAISGPASRLFRCVGQPRAAVVAHWSVGHVGHHRGAAAAGTRLKSKAANCGCGLMQLTGSVKTTHTGQLSIQRPLLGSQSVRRHRCERADNGFVPWSVRWMFNPWPRQFCARTRTANGTTRRFSSEWH